MHEGKVVHFEDDNSWQDIVRRQLDGSSHQVVSGAVTVPDAFSVLEQVQNGELDANVVILDGNLSESASCNDALTIRERISELGLPVRVIGFSSIDLTSKGIEVDATLLKTDYEYGSIVRVIDELPELESTDTAS